MAEQARTWLDEKCRCGHLRKEHGPGIPVEIGPFGGRCCQGPVDQQCRCLAFAAGGADG